MESQRENDGMCLFFHLIVFCGFHIMNCALVIFSPLHCFTLLSYGIFYQGKDIWEALFVFDFGFFFFLRFSLFFHPAFVSVYLWGLVYLYMRRAGRRFFVCSLT